MGAGEPVRVEVAEQSDEDLLVRVRAGDDRAFAALSDRHRAWLVRVCTGVLGDRHLAEDVAQETLVKAYRLIATDDAPARLRPWLRVVARHACIDEQRRRLPEPFEVVPECAASGADAERLDPGHVVAEELDVPLATAWARLGSRHREVLRQRELRGLSYAEIAATMGLSLAAVETLLFRARAALRREYSRAGGTALPPESLARSLILIDASSVRPAAPLLHALGNQAAHMAAEAAPALTHGAQSGGVVDAWRELAAGVAATVLALGLLAPPAPRAADSPSVVETPSVESVAVPDMAGAQEVDAPEAPAAPEADVPDSPVDGPDAPDAAPPDASEAPPPDAEEAGRIRTAVTKTRDAAITVAKRVAAEPGQITERIFD